MKTPMQELIETFEEMKDPNVESSIDVDFAISLAKSMLEKEKEVIENAYDSGQESNWSEDMGLMGDWHYDKTFNNE